ncbi:IclR family transcriptional regulator [Rhodoplanes roseus]|uniref:IclR family transcriptional regulator n=1 Tax=Rhodoplanes roseus TaxID=29409 RepID=A0A327L5M7_9BRAD|nr:IclR family transcriptional regulator [Rhodoplanes roseus]RAI44862.1 IclR family transcriptional regulator [Rhodoplanes roseus]
MALPAKSMPFSPSPTVGLPRLDPKEAKNSVQSLAKGLRVLECFSTGADEMTLSEIAAASGLDAGTTFRMLNTLVALGYVARIPESRRFRLSLKVLDLGFNAIAHRDLRATVRPLLQSLVDEVSEAASFAVLEDGDVFYIERVRAGFTRLGVDIRIGTTMQAHRTSIGRAILAFLPESRLERALAAPPRHPMPTVRPVDRASLDPILAAIRADGYLLEASALSTELRLLVVPVVGADGWATGAISVVAPTTQSSNDDLKARALEPMRAAARHIARAQEANGSTSFVAAS